MRQKNVCDYSYHSACEDRRFEPLQKRELPPIENDGERALLEQLQVGIDGLLLKNSCHSAIFLPSVWQSVITAAEFVTH